MNPGPPGEHELYDYLVFRELEERRRDVEEAAEDEETPPQDEQDDDDGRSPSRI